HGLHRVAAAQFGHHRADYLGGTRGLGRGRRPLELLNDRTPAVHHSRGDLGAADVKTDGQGHRAPHSGPLRPPRPPLRSPWWRAPRRGAPRPASGYPPTTSRLATARPTTRARPRGGGPTAWPRRRSACPGPR